MRLKTLLIALLTCSPLAAKDAFLAQNCLACHSSAAKQGGLDLESLEPPSDHGSLQTWIRVHDRVRDGEMPPAPMPRPSAGSRAEFLANLADDIAATDRENRQETGRVHARRLTRVEYENTVHQLLGIRIPLQRYLPEPSSQGIFDTLAKSQQISHFVLEKYLTAADAALDAAFARALDPPTRWQRDFAISDISTSHGSNQRQPVTHPNGQWAVTWSTGVNFYGRMLATRVPAEGWYRIRLRASAVNPDDTGRVWARLRTGECYARAPSMFWVGALELTEEPREFTFDTWIRYDHMLQLQPGDFTVPRPGGNVIRDASYEENAARNLAGVAIHSLEMERIYPGDSAEQAQRRLFGSARVRRDDQGSRAIVESLNPRADLRKLLTQFARRAFRRPVSATEIGPYTRLADQKLAAGAPFAEAIRAGYRALLVAPRFLYLTEPPGALDDHQIASRLSYFLWSSPPDGILAAAASQGQLRDPELRRGQVERMLADPRADAFTRNFTAQWLDLSDIDFTQPDRDLFPKFDEILKNSMLAETRAFFDELLAKDLSVTEFVDSDFLLLNARLAKHYGVPAPESLGLQRVDTPPGSHRGGLLGQGAILKVTANGTNTSPVVRGAWVTERILGRPVPPPPPNVSAIEPDVRGAKTIREQLAKHRNNPACAACHARIDPPGFALENFDPTGRWRTNYPVVAEQTDRRTKWKDGPAVDASYTMEDGAPFHDIGEFKGLLAKEPKEVAANVAEQLLVYATGAEVGFAGRAEIEQIVENTADSGYGLRSLVHGVTQSELFLTK